MEDDIVNYKAEFEFGGCSFYLEMHGDWDTCYEAAKKLAPKLGAVFTGMLECME